MAWKRINRSDTKKDIRSRAMYKGFWHKYTDLYKQAFTDKVDSFLFADVLIHKEPRRRRKILKRG